MSQGFPERVRDKLNEIFKDEPSFKPFEVESNPNAGPDKGNKWEVIAYEWLWFNCRVVKEKEDGTVWIWSDSLGVIDDGLRDLVHDIYEQRIERVKTEEEKLRKKEEEEFEKALDDIVHKRWDKYLRKRAYQGTIIYKFWAEEIAKKMSEQCRFKVEHFIDDDKVLLHD
ncbi:MAG: hypothetical protein QXU11_00665 [Thermoproteota archaeon]